MMAYVSNHNRLIFIHIYKTAGMAIRSFMKDIDQDCFEVGGGHSDILQTMSLLGRDDILVPCLGYTKFSVVRNPYAWLLSIRNYALSYYNHPLNLDAHVHSLDDFIIWYIASQDMLNNTGKFNGKLQTQSQYVYVNGEKWVDYILHTETLEKDLYEMLNNLHILYDEKCRLKYVNVNIYERNEEYEKVFKRHTLDLINNFYHEDFVNFNYQKI